MKLLALSLLFASWAPLPARAAQLKDVKSVYLYPMSGGFDQLLANRITSGHIFQVVSDPKLADAVFTDQLGAAFEYRLNHIVAPPPAPAAAPGTPQAQAAADSEPKVSSFSHGRGTVFLVDAKSKQVLWSAYQPPKNGSPHELDRTAKKVAGTLASNLKPSAPKQQ
jgi:hypothetical protein